MFLLVVHTVTMRGGGRVVQAQFVHACSRLGGAPPALTLVGGRMRARAARGGGGAKGRQMGAVGELRSIVKGSAASVRHSLRAVHVNPQLQNILVSRTENVEVPTNVAPRNPIPLPQENLEVAGAAQPNTARVQLNENSSPEETAKWLQLNRFDKYVGTFERFSGDDMLRMSREDLIQICGDADGIRLHNAIHMKAIAPKLKIYVRPQGSPAFTAVLLTSHSGAELARKLAAAAGVAAARVRDVHLEGPHGISVRLDDDLLRHVRHDAMFALEVVGATGAPTGGACVLMLRRLPK